MIKGRSWLMVTMVVSSLALQAQDTDALLLKQDSLLTYEDSVSIFKLIDSLMNLEELTPSSQLAIRLAYNSNVLWAGRTLGIDQFGLAPGLSYYHKSGLFTDLTTFWSKDYDPSYYLTIATAGYMHSFSRKFSIIASYDRYFYNLDSGYIPYNNAMSISPFLELNPLIIRLDYALYFGDETVNRLMPSLGFQFEKFNLFKIDRMSITPTAFLLMGDQETSEIIFPSTRQEWIAAYLRVRQGLTWYTVKTQRVFGIMNYAFMLPVNIRDNSWNLSFSYTYNIPKALPGETLTLENSSFLSASFTWFFDLSPKKSPL